MNPYSYSTRLSRVYSFDNSQNGGLGPLGFINNITNPRIIKKNIVNKNDLTVYLLFSDATTNSDLELLTNRVSNIKGYKLSFQKYLVTQNNYLNIIKKINSNSNSKFMIVDNTIINYFNNLKIPFKIYYSINGIEIDDIINHIYSILFSNFYEKNLRI